MQEGVDLPALDAVAMVSPRGSELEIIQIVGRAQRVDPKRGVVDPKGSDDRAVVLVPAGLNRRAGRRHLAATLSALACVDEEFDAKLTAARGCATCIPIGPS
eukprot:1196103-Prorocentrum_minimum.AAC.3